MTKQFNLKNVNVINNFCDDNENIKTIYDIIPLNENVENENTKQINETMKYLNAKQPDDVREHDIDIDNLDAIKRERELIMNAKNMNDLNNNVINADTYTIESFYFDENSDKYKMYDIFDDDIKNNDNNFKLFKNVLLQFSNNIFKYALMNYIDINNL